ncbi:E3.1.3.1 [Mytilus coruscus]|uniref:alkaline phosphatase n=1 Tax=Mytilus coruscus TaxID=42192 RepID=A0A6J8EBG9_MYTCO|nr:E3.1.3.1 [Mytilus coruscus]
MPEMRFVSQVYWRNQAKDELQKYLKSQKIEKVARNVIFFLGDGMSIPTITAARIRQGQLNNKTGEENVLSWEKFPHTNLLELLTTTRITHATPGAAYANTAYRNWEVDWQLENVTNKENCPDIAKQLINDYKSSIKVLMGGGRRYFLPNNETDPVIGLNSKNGRRDNRNLIEVSLVKNDGKVSMAGDNLPYTTLAYANGPGAVKNPRMNLTGEHTVIKHYIKVKENTNNCYL